MEHIDRTERIEIRVTKKKKEMLLERMQYCDQNSLSSYIRAMALDGYILVVDHEDIKQYNYELHKIGVNINQIAKLCNETNSVFEKDILRLKEMMENIWQLQKSSQYIQL